VSDAQTDHLVALAVRLHGLIYDAGEGGPRIIGSEQRAEVEDLVGELDAHDLSLYAPGAASVVRVARWLLDGAPDLSVTDE
jgi:hypothetical protein